MDKTVTAAEANRGFSRILRQVREGESFVVTSHGAPVARIAPVARDVAEREAAKRRLLERLRSKPVTNIGPWTRAELYDE